MPTDPEGQEDLYIPEGQKTAAMTGDIVRAKITSRASATARPSTRPNHRNLERTQKRFVGTLIQSHDRNGCVLPDGNILTEPILTPDAASRHIKAGTKVVVELTTYPEAGQQAQGVITEVLGEPGEKDVDLQIDHRAAQSARGNSPKMSLDASPSRGG